LFLNFELQTILRFHLIVVYNRGRHGGAVQIAKRKKRQEEFWSRKQHEQDLARTSPASTPRDWTPEPNSQELLPTSTVPVPDLSMDLFLLDRKYMFLEDDHREAV
jgi:hypothetical protein